MPILELKDVEKRYGKLTALAGLDMNVDPGEVYGFLGRNGAGKSTAMRIVMGITQPQSGSVHLFGEPAPDFGGSLRQRVGYVAQEHNFYGWMTVKRIGEFVRGFYPSWDPSEFERLATQLDLPLKQKIQTLSGGMQAKLALSLALAHRPMLLLLDEPTAGMDAVARREFIDIVRDQARHAGRTTVFSSHLIDEVERAADRVGIVSDGRMLYEGSLHVLTQCVRRLVFEGDGAQAVSLPDVVDARDFAWVLRDQQRDGRREVMVRFDAPPPSSLWVGPWSLEQPSLEDIFISLTTKAVDL